MTQDALDDLAAMRARSRREMVVVWSRDAMPAWRKVTYYQPRMKVLVLEEQGDPAALETRARLWVGAEIRRQYPGPAPIRIDLPAGARIVWLLAGGRENELARVTTIRKAVNVFYTDVPAQGTSFQWGAFQFVAPAAAPGVTLPESESAATQEPSPLAELAPVRGTR
jgi:hypothetical protein